MSEPKYKMTVDLNVLEHLGINLYSNIAAVLTEAVANAWDADATMVDIVLDQTAGEISISDNGVGMSVDDINAKYLHIGYRRRNSGKDITALGRKVMGRKGLGKLSLFSIAKVIDVQSAKDGWSNGLRMDIDEIRAALKENRTDYSPQPLPEDEIIVRKGTIIRLTHVTRPDLFSSLDVLRTQLARRFSVIGANQKFTVKLNSTPITINDRCELLKAQFLWQIGDTRVTPPVGADIKNINSIVVPSGEHMVPLRGWIATASRPKELSTPSGNMNGIVVIARGRLIQENVLDKLNDGRIYTKYITGQIEADGLDESEEADIATSDRQRLKEDDPRYVDLLNTIKALLAKVEASWNSLRRQYEVRKTKETIPAVAEWMDTLEPGHKENAEKMLAQISSLHIEDEEDRRTLIRHGILAFERMRLRGSAEKFVDNLMNPQQLLQLLADRDSVEASLYHDIVKSRLEAIRCLCDIVDTDKKEKVIQQYLFDHLWLLDPMWERATGSERIEQALKKEFREFADDLPEDESKGRIDIRYKTSAGKHIIVELKRYSRKLKVLELVEQGQKYLFGLEQCLASMQVKNPQIEIVFVLGSEVAEAHRGDYVERTLAPINARIVYYEGMIRRAQDSYGEYLKKSKRVDSLNEVLEKI